MTRISVGGPTPRRRHLQKIIDSPEGSWFYQVYTGCTKNRLAGGRVLNVPDKIGDFSQGRQGRWRIACLLGAGTFVAYLDRVNLSIAAAPIAQDLGLSNTQIGVILSAFLWSYAAVQIPMGLIVDRFGTRGPVLIAIALWVASSFATVFVQSFAVMIMVRLILGISEGPMMPAFWRSITLWFEPEERGTSNAILDVGAKLSYVLGVPVMAWAISRFGWHACFVLTGVITMIYGLIFLVIYSDPPTAAGVPAPPSFSVFRPVVLSRKLWGVALGYSAYVYVYYLLATWMPRLLQDQLGVSVLVSGLYTALPWAFAIVCEIAIGGWLADRLARNSAEPGRVRQWVAAIGLLASLALLGAVASHSPLVVLVCLSVSAAGLAVSMPAAASLIGLVSPRGSVGTVGALTNFVANCVGLSAPIVTGWLVDTTGGFFAAGVVAAVVVVIGAAAYTGLLGKVEPIRISDSATVAG